MLRCDLYVRIAVPQSESRNARGRVSHKGTDKMKNFIKLLRSKRGASAAEYALILAIIGAAIAVAALALSGAIADEMNDAGSCITNTSTC